jgi:predicted secreted acid phosphatase
VVSDLDETLLDNRPFFDGCADKEESQINWDSFEDWQKKSSARPLKYTEEMLAYARSKGLAVFFITGRMERLRRPTIENLIRYGIAYDGLYMRANGDQQNASTMKAAYRKQIEDMGFKIVVNIGDQYSDLSGGHSLDCEKLPNKIYFIR